MIELLVDCDSQVRQAAAVVVAHLLDRKSLTEISTRIEPLLLQATAHPELRQAAITALADNAPLFSSAVGILTVGLEDKNFSIRWDAAHCLGKYGAAAQMAMPALAGLMADEDDPSISHFAKASLLKIREAINAEGNTADQNGDKRSGRY